MPTANAAANEHNTPTITKGLFMSLNNDDNKNAVNIYLATSKNQSPIFLPHVANIVLLFENQK